MLLITQNEVKLSTAIVQGKTELVMLKNLSPRNYCQSQTLFTNYKECLVIIYLHKNCKVT